MAMNRVFLSIISVFIIVGVLAVYQATTNTSSAVLLPSELLKRKTENPAVKLPRIRVGGKVSDLPVDYKVEPEIELRFNIVDPGQKNLAVESSETIPVVYKNLKPDMFAPGRDVIIEGEFSDGVLIANNLLTQCPSKYEPPSPEKKKTDSSEISN